MAYKHDAIVPAWLDGKTIQYKNANGKWTDRATCTITDHPDTAFSVPEFSTSIQYRIKPEPKLIYLFIRLKDGAALTVTSCKTTGEAWKNNHGVKSGDYIVHTIPNPVLNEEHSSYA